jgi:hypothetical protein
MLDTYRIVRIISAPKYHGKYRMARSLASASLLVSLGSAPHRSALTTLQPQRQTEASGASVAQGQFWISAPASTPCQPHRQQPQGASLKAGWQHRQLYKKALLESTETDVTETQSSPTLTQREEMQVVL